jgi:hypothetical protein
MVLAVGFTFCCYVELFSESCLPDYNVKDWKAIDQKYCTLFKIVTEADEAGS